MSDLLTLLDQAIDGLASDVSSRCSRSQVHREGLTGTPTLLETKTFPLFPLFPVKNRKRTEAMRACVKMPATILLRVRGSRTRGPFKIEREQREQRDLNWKTNGLLFPRLLWKLGTTGTTSKRPPLVLLDGYLRAALQRPPSWADPTALPSRGCFCSCCKGRRWWREREAPKGWRCSVYYPPDHLPSIAVAEMTT